MSIFDMISKLIKNQNEDNELVNVSNESSTSIKDVLNLNAKNGSSIEVKDAYIGNTVTQKITVNQYFIEDKVEVADNKKIELRLKDIRKLLDKGKSKEALQGYTQLQSYMFGETLTVNDSFLILNGIYNCYVNLHGYERDMEALERKIFELSDAAEFYKFKYLMSVKHFNKQELQKTIELCDEALELKHNYNKAIALKTIAQFIEKEIGYDEGIEIIQKMEEEFSGCNRDKSNIIIAKGDIAFSAKRYKEAKAYYIKANKEFPLTNYKLGIAMCHFYLAVKEVTDTGYISFDKIDYDELHEAIKLFEAIEKEARENDEDEVLRRMLPFYLNSLELIDEPKKIIDVKMKSSDLLDLTDKNIAIIAAHAELYLGGLTEDTTKALDNTDKLKLELKQLALKDKYQDVVDKLKPHIDSIFNNDESMIAMLLVSLIKVNDDEFIPQFKKYRDRNPDDIKYDLIWIQYLEQNNEIVEAKEFLDKLIEKNPNPIVLRDAYKFYQRNSFKEKVNEITSKVVKKEYKVRSIDLLGYIKNHFFGLIDNKQYEDAEEFYNTIDFKIFNDTEKLQMEIEYYRLLGEVSILAEKTLAYSELKDNRRVALNSSSFFMVSNQVGKAIRTLEDIKNSKKYEKSELYMQLTQLYLLIHDYDSAYESALKAKEIDIDFHKSESHRFFMTTCMRTNRIDDSVKYMIDFHEEFPKENWVRTVRILKEDENGNEVLDTDELNAILGDRSRYNLIRDAFFNYQIGLSTYMHLLHEMKLDIIFNELRYKKKQIKITEGNVEIVNITFEIIKNELLVDALSLYVLSESEVLYLLDGFDKILITYTTIEFLQFMLINHESKEIRSIIEYIDKSVNVKLVPVKLSLIKENKMFLDETMHCLGYSNKYEVPYLTVDFNLKKLFRDNAKFVVDIPSVLRSLTLQDNDKRNIYSKVAYLILKKGYTFINFSAFDLFDKFQTLDNFDNIKNEFDVYLSMTRYCDYASFIRVYNLFLIMIGNRLQKEDYLKFVEMIFTYLDWYVGRTRYYFNQVQEILELSDEESQFFRSKRLVAETLALSTYLDSHQDSKLYSLLYREFNYVKLVNIITPIIIGIYAFFLRYKDDPEHIKFYQEFLKSKLKHIDDFSLDQIIVEAIKQS